MYPACKQNEDNKMGYTWLHSSDTMQICSFLRGSMLDVLDSCGHCVTIVICFFIDCLFTLLLSPAYHSPGGHTLLSFSLIHHGRWIYSWCKLPTLMWYTYIHTLLLVAGPTCMQGKTVFLHSSCGAFTHQFVSWNCSRHSIAANDFNLHVPTAWHALIWGKGWRMLFVNLCCV